MQKIEEKFIKVKKIRRFLDTKVGVIEDLENGPYICIEV